MWDGSNLLHGNKENKEGLTRVSMDFRVIELKKLHPFKQRKHSHSVKSEIDITMSKYSSDITGIVCYYNNPGTINYMIDLSCKLNKGIRWLVETSQAPNAKLTDNAEQITGKYDPNLLKDNSGYNERYGFFTINTLEYMTQLHAMGLNNLVEHINTRYVLVNDPDFFVFQPLDSVIEHMNINNLAFFGAPYHPEVIDVQPEKNWHCSTQYNEQGEYIQLPTCWHTIIDLEKFDKNNIDFYPGYPNHDVERYKRISSHIQCGSKLNLHSLDYNTETLVPSIKYSFGGGKKITCAGDMIKEYKFKPEHYTLKSIYDEYDIEKNPDKLYYTNTLEEYYWQDKLYGVHSRGRLRGGDITSDRLDLKLEKIRKIVAKV